MQATACKCKQGSASKVREEGAPEAENTTRQLPWLLRMRLSRSGRCGASLRYHTQFQLQVRLAWPSPRATTAGLGLCWRRHGSWCSEQAVRQTEPSLPLRSLAWVTKTKTSNYSSPLTNPIIFLVLFHPSEISWSMNLQIGHLQINHLLRGIMVNRTYGTHKNLYISLFSLTIFGPIYYGPP